MAHKYSLVTSSVTSEKLEMVGLLWNPILIPERESREHLNKNWENFDYEKGSNTPDKLSVSFDVW